MDIISENNAKGLTRYKSSHLRYAVIYIVITFAILLFLNIYSAKTSQAIFYNNKESAMLDRCYLATAEISELQVINQSTVKDAISSVSSLRVNRVIVTDESAKVIYDSDGDYEVNTFALFPEIVESLGGNDVFNWQYDDGNMISRAATPIVSYGNLIGCVYMMENDLQQAALLRSLMVNTFSITIILEALLIAFSIFFANSFTTRLGKIMDSIRVVRSGDYSHKISMGGNDELTILADEFNSMAERLHISENKRRQFVSDASHELKTPLASIKLLSDSILHNDMDLETTKEFVEDIGNEADRLTRMTEKLLTLTHTEQPQEEAFELTYIAPTVERVANMLSIHAGNSGVTIILELEEDSQILVKEDDLYQIIFNLSENGIKYNVPGGQLRIRLTKADDTAVLTVADTGMGIPEESIPHIFERFYRVDKARSRQTGGSGLGLSIVRSIVERNGGQISVQSQLGKGTVFTLQFPIFDTEVAQ